MFEWWDVIRGIFGKGIAEIIVLVLAGLGFLLLKALSNGFRAVIRYFLKLRRARTAVAREKSGDG